jgi:transposase InsO family protein
LTFRRASTAANISLFATRISSGTSQYESSVGSVGDSYDNALAETINGLYKTEVIRNRGPWRNIDDVEFATLEWVDWFNNRQVTGANWEYSTGRIRTGILSPIGGVN